MIKSFSIALLLLLFVSCEFSDHADIEKRVEAEKQEKLDEIAAEEALLKAERDARIAAIPEFIDLGDTLNFTDGNGLKQGVWEFYAEGFDEFNITPFGATEPLQLDGMLSERHQYRNDTLHGVYESFDIFGGGRKCVEGLYIMGERDGIWDYPCRGTDTVYSSVYD